MRKEAQQVEAASRHGARRVRDALTMAYERQQQRESGERRSWGKGWSCVPSSLWVSSGWGQHWRCDSVTWRDVKGSFVSLSPLSFSWTHDFRGDMDSNTLAWSLAGRMNTIDRIQRVHIWWAYGETGTLLTVGMNTGATLIEGNVVIPTKLHGHLPSDLVISILRFHLEYMPPTAWKYTYTQIIHCSIVCNCKILETYMPLWKREWM